MFLQRTAIASTPGSSSWIKRKVSWSEWLTCPEMAQRRRDRLLFVVHRSTSSSSAWVNGGLAWMIKPTR